MITGCCCHYKKKLHHSGCYTGNRLLLLTSNIHTVGIHFCFSEYFDSTVAFKDERCVYFIHTKQSQMRKACCLHLRAFHWKPIRLDVPAGKWPSLSEGECSDRILAKLTNVYFRQPILGFKLGTGT